MSKKSEIFIINGTPGAGKSTVAKILLQRYEYGYHIPIDDLREWVISGQSVETTVDKILERTR